MKSYFDKVHTWGRISCITTICVLFLVPVVFCIHYNAWPPLQGVLKGLAAVMPLYWATAVAEVISYAPLLGAGGSYLSFVTGNIANLKLPCAISAIENAKVRPNTEEGEVVTTISIAASSITTTVIIALGVLLFQPILPKLTAPGSVFAPAFQQIIPALFGAIGASYFIKHIKLSILPILAGTIVLVFAPALSIGILIVVTIVVSIGSAYLMYKKNWV
ncbi:MAG: hypothetical protein IJT41_10490 [Clostridia bacterium]|nr:hypothetical protein [Clostridia bacterium]MBQ7547382.1 hypothetical protein [Clostridia bacterium]